MEADRTSKVVALLNQILGEELAGVVRCTHYSLMVFGYSRIPIVAWFREEAAESLRHAEQAGEMITHLGAHPSLVIGPLLDSHKSELRSMLLESLQTEERALGLYRELLQLAEGRSVLLEEYARRMVYAEGMHADAVQKMLRSQPPAPPPGQAAAKTSP